MKIDEESLREITGISEREKCVYFLKPSSPTNLVKSINLHTQELKEFKQNKLKEIHALKHHCQTAESQRHIKNHECSEKQLIT